MSDRPLPQQSLASSLADLQLSAVKPSSAGVWMAAFWEVVGAKWSGIDVLRMEKFLLLVRRVFCAGARWVLEGATKGKGKEGEMRAGVFVEALKGGPLGRYEDGDKEMPLGLRLHVVDLWADELDRAGALGDGPAAQTAAAKKMVEGVGELARGLTKGGPSKPLRTKAAESLADERLPWYEAPAPEEEEAGWEGFGD